MRTGNFVSVDYSSLLPQTPPSEVQTNVSGRVEEEWGSLDAHCLNVSSLNVIRVRAQLKKGIHIRHYEHNECSTVNSCFVINGTIQSSFHGMDKDLTLRRGLQNFIYKPVLMDDHFVGAGDGELVLLHVAIDRDYYMDLLANEKWCEELKSRISARQLVSGGDYDLEITPAMHRVIDNIMYCPFDGPFSNLLLEARVLELVAHQLHQYNAGITTELSRTINREREIFFSIREYLEKNFQKDHSLRSLSRMFGLNEFKLKKGFRDCFGDTVFGYIHEQKMRHARTLLEDGGISVAQAAADTGYKNPNHFSAAFKKQFGWSPSTLRRKVAAL